MLREGVLRGSLLRGTLLRDAWDIGSKWRIGIVKSLHPFKVNVDGFDSLDQALEWDKVDGTEDEAKGRRILPPHRGIQKSFKQRASIGIATTSDAD